MKILNSPSFLPPLLFTILLQWCSVANSEKILVLSFFSSKSHKITYMTLIEELAKKGHQITVVSPVKTQKTVENITEIYTFDIEKDVFSKMDPLKIKAANEKLNLLRLFDSFEKVCVKTYNLPQVKDLLKQTFDLIFIAPATMNECSMGLVWKLNAPFVFFTSTSIPHIYAGLTGTHLPPSFVPNMLMDYSSEMNFMERFYNFGICLVYEFGSMFLYEPLMTRIYREQLGDENIPPVRQIMSNVSLILSNGHFSMSGARPYLPNIVDVGGIHSKPAKKLPENLEAFVSKKGSKGFIYFSMGTIINTKDMPEEKRQMFLNVFSRFQDYQIIWKWNDDEQMKGQPENVLLSKWLPQQDILGHEKIKMFITHCGGGGIEESVYHGVPLIGMPIISDQPLNSKMAKRLGILYEMDWNDLTEKSLYEGITEVLQNKKYIENVKRLSTIFKDQPDSPMNRGVYWIEYVLRHKGGMEINNSLKVLELYNLFQVLHNSDLLPEN